MAKYRIVKTEYSNGQIEYEAQKKILGLFWWNFNNINGYKTGVYDSLEEAKRMIEMDRGTTKETIIKVE